jgi:hypothetical protein
MTSPEPLTVQQLQAHLDQIHADLSTAAATAATLQTWCQGLPRRHVPPDEEVRLFHLLPAAVPDPLALDRQAGEVAVLVSRATTEVGRFHDRLAAEIGRFLGPGAGGPNAG